MPIYARTDWPEREGRKGVVLWMCRCLILKLSQRRQMLLASTGYDSRQRRKAVIICLWRYAYPSRHPIPSNLLQLQHSFHDCAFPTGFAWHVFPTSPPTPVTSESRNDEQCLSFFVTSARPLRLPSPRGTLQTSRRYFLCKVHYKGVGRMET